MNPEEFFQPLSNRRPFLKMGLYGGAGSGKSFTAVQILIGLHEKINSKKPIAIVDTEEAIHTLLPLFQDAGIETQVSYSRSLTDLGKALEFCEKGYSDMILIDSITHIWMDFCDSYQKEKRRQFLQFADWGILKPRWKKNFSDRITQNNLHVIFNGRMGFEYSWEENEDTGKKELVTTGAKMKAETETAYEPDILVEMQKQKVFAAGQTEEIVNCARVLKDRNYQINGKLFKLPKFEDFYPSIQRSLKGTSKPKNIEEKDSFEDVKFGKNEDKQRRAVLIEEIAGLFAEIAPGTTKDEKALKNAIFFKLFKTRSKTSMETGDLDSLERGFEILQKISEERRAVINENIEVDDLDRWIDDIIERFDKGILANFEDREKKLIDDPQVKAAVESLENVAEDLDAEVKGAPEEPNGSTPEETPKIVKDLAKKQKEIF